MPFKIRTKLLIAFISVVLFLSIFGLIIGVYNIRLILRTVSDVEYVAADPKAVKDALHLITRTTWQTLYIMLIGGYIVAVFSILLSRYISRILVRPIKAIHDSADRIARGDFRARLDIKTGDEIEEMANTMNEMVAQLEGLYSNMQAMVGERTRELKESEERFYTMAASAQDGIIMVDNEGRVSFWNKAAERIFGYTIDEALGKDLHKLIVPQRFYDDFLKGFKRFQETGDGPVIGKTLELAGIKKNGTEFYTEHSVSAVKIKGKWHAIGVIRDITERKKAEEKIKEQMDYLERFQKATVQREFRIKELKDRVKELEEGLKKK